MKASDEIYLRIEGIKTDNVFMATPYLSPYADPKAHAQISALIRNHSSNREDVRGAMLRTLDFGAARDVLDLGCGFGFWAEILAERVAPAASFTGMDACDRDEGPYRRCIEKTGREARFICTNLVSKLPFDDDSFDLIIAAYSLYFFPFIIPEVARVLRPGGTFLAVTHSEHSFTGLLGAIDLSPDDSPLIRLIRQFSAENGRVQLVRSFGEVRRIDYENSLSFYEEDRGDLLAYLQFKLPLLDPGARFEKGVPYELTRRASDTLRHSGRVIVQKDDALFLCGGNDGR